MGNSNVTEVDTVAFFDAGGQINVSAGAAGFNFVTTSDVPFRFTPNSTNVLDIDDSGLTVDCGEQTHPTQPRHLNPRSVYRWS